MKSEVSSAMKMMTVMLALLLALLMTLLMSLPHDTADAASR